MLDFVREAFDILSFALKAEGIDEASYQLFEPKPDGDEYLLLTHRELREDGAGKDAWEVCFIERGARTRRAVFESAYDAANFFYG